MSNAAAMAAAKTSSAFRLFVYFFLSANASRAKITPNSSTCSIPAP
jgi:hypothetical protein